VSATIYYDSVNEVYTTSVTFTSPPGNPPGSVPADPTTVTCTIIDPTGKATTHSYQGTAPADIIKLSTGKYTLTVPCSAPVDGLWGAQWNGTGAVSDFQMATWRVMPANVSQLWYCGLEEMHDRLGITDTSDDSLLITAIATAAGWINEYCGRHFYRITEARTYQPTSVWTLDIDDLVDDPSIAMAVDMDGDGVYETPWVRGTDYVLRYGPGRFNPNYTGQARPFRQLQVVQSGKWLPFTWPYSHLNRIQITGPWGWPSVPWPVAESNRILAADVYKTKDAPFGVAGVSDIGVIRIQSNTSVVENLQPFINPRHKVGI
jgi:hypothetical protein